LLDHFNGNVSCRFDFNRDLLKPKWGSGPSRTAAIVISAHAIGQKTIQASDIPVATGRTPTTLELDWNWLVSSWISAATSR